MTISYFSHFGLYSSMDRLTANIDYDSLTAQFQDSVVQPPKFLVGCHIFQCTFIFKVPKRLRKLNA